MAEERPAVPLRIEESFHGGCPRHPTTRERIEAHLGQIRDAAPGEQAIDLRFDIVRHGALSDGTLTLSLGGVSVERKASSKSCADVIAALSMMAAIAIGEETERLSNETAVPPPPVAPGPRTPSADVAVEPPSPAPDTIPRSSSVASATHEKRPIRGQPRHVGLSFGTSVEVQGNRGAVVMPTWFGQVTLPVPLDPSLRVGLGRTFGEDASSPRGDATIRWTVMTLAVCGTLLRGERFRFGPCVNGELGRLEATRVDPLPANKLFYFWPTAGASGKLSWDVTRQFSLDFSIGVRVPLIGRELYFNPDRNNAVYQTPVIVPFAGFGAAVRLL